ncbi:MAG: neutral/alkaline non-lysosomal ceramidase N-terminal domain-containing protein [Myxococcota bacterium]
MRSNFGTCAAIASVFLLIACSGDDSGPSDATIEPDAMVDASMDASADADAAPDADPPIVPASTDHCAYESPPATALAGGTVETQPLTAGTAEMALRIPVGSTLGAYTARADFLGSVPPVDGRFVEIAGAFAPSVGIETYPRARALALGSGPERVVILKADIAFASDDLTYELARRLGPEFSGKVLLSTSHSHSGWGHFTSNSVLQIGVGVRRASVFEPLLNDLEELSRAALGSMTPAQIGVHHDPNFDTADQVTRDRRSENDALAGGPKKDQDLFLIRVDRTDGSPLAILPVFGIHGTVLDADNLLASTDSTGAIERAIEESFDEPVMVMHLQGAAGDVSPAGTGDLDCSSETEPCYRFVRSEMIGRIALGPLRSAWEQAGTNMAAETRIEMLTRSIELGPNWENFTVRNGDLRYAPWDGERQPDGEIFGPGGGILSPIDEFNAPVGAALCGEPMPAIFPLGALPGAGSLAPYRSCVAVDAAAVGLGIAIDLPFEDMPPCGTTRTTVSALRIGDFLFVTIPGEPVTLLADALRAASPAPPENTVILGFSQGHVGYVMTPEDWLAGGFEPTINVWGPLEGQRIFEQALDLMTLGWSDTREDGEAAGSDRYVPPELIDAIPAADPAPLAGTIPTMIPERVYRRGSEPITNAQPDPQVRRLESAYFAWIGEDPMTGTPSVVLEREVGGAFTPVQRGSGRIVTDGELLLTHTPLPLIRDAGMPRTHYWVVEFQAVTPWGLPGLEEIADRPGLPLGRYRFRVSGSGYTLESEPFEVLPTTIDVTATQVGTNVNLTLAYRALNGFRLLHPTMDSNRPVPMQGGMVEVVATDDGGATRSLTVAVADDGTATFDAGANTIASVTVTDRFMNSGSAPTM